MADDLVKLSDVAEAIFRHAEKIEQINGAGAAACRLLAMEFEDKARKGEPPATGDAGTAMGFTTDESRRGHVFSLKRRLNNLLIAVKPFATYGALVTTADRGAEWMGVGGVTITYGDLITLTDAYHREVPAGPTENKGANNG